MEALRPMFQSKRHKLRDAPAPRSDWSAAAADHDDPETTMPELRTEPVYAPDEAEAQEREAVTFAEIGKDLERRSRESVTMVRLLEQHRQQLQTAEAERDHAYDKLAEIVPIVQDTARALREAMDARQLEDDPARMHRLFLLNGRALDELEKIAVTLFADFLWVKNSWEQYARTAEAGRRLRGG